MWAKIIAHGTPEDTPNEEVEAKSSSEEDQVAPIFKTSVMNKYFKEHIDTSHYKQLQEKFREEIDQETKIRFTKEEV